METKTIKDIEAGKKDRWTEENDGDILGDVITNLLDTRLGINDKKVSIKLVSGHLLIGSIKPGITRPPLDYTPTEITVKMPKWAVDYLKGLREFEGIDDALFCLARAYYQKDTY